MGGVRSFIHSSFLSFLLESERGSQGGSQPASQIDKSESGNEDEDEHGMRFVVRVRMRKSG
jgi:hypothetical protein